MSGTVTKVLSRVLAVVAGIVWGFFVAFNMVFSDIFGVGQMLVAILYVFVAYLGLGLLYGVAGPKTSWRWTPWLATPGALLVLSMISDNPGRILYVLGVLVALVGATLAGTWSGAFVRDRLGARRTPGSDAGTHVV